MRKIILLNLMVIGLVGALVASASTFAYFSDTASSTDNSFTAGTLNLKVANNADYPSFTDSTNLTWTAPAGWAPGDSVVARLWMKNVGNVPIWGIWANFVDTTAAPDVLLDKIIVTSVRDSFPYLTDPAFGTEYIGNFACRDASPTDGKITLREWMASPAPAGCPAGRPAGYELFWRADAPLDETAPGTPPPVLAPGAEFGVQLTFQFDPSADNSYQSKSASFDLNLVGVQKGFPTQAP